MKWISLLFLCSFGGSILADRIALAEGRASMDLPDAEAVNFSFQHIDGSITITGHDAAQVRVEALGGDEDDIPSLLDWNEKKRTVRLKLGSDTGSDGINLWLPRNTNITLQTIEGDVRISGIRGSIEVRLVDGDIMLAENFGAILVETVDGDIELSQAASESKEPISLLSRDGDITLLTSADFKGSASMSTVDGDITCDIPNSDESGTAPKEKSGWKYGPMNRKSISLNGGGRPVLMNTVDGDIIIGIR